MFIKTLQICYQFDIGRLKTRYRAGITLAGSLLGAAEAQPFGGHAQPLGDHA